MTLKIVRQPSTDTGTPGAGAVLETLFTFNTLELPWRQNLPDLSCIPQGVYNAEIVQSPRFGHAVILLLAVPGRENCEIHSGNWAGDVQKGYASDIEGCILVGQGYGQLTPPTGCGPQFAILNSRDTLNKLLANIGQGPHVVAISWADGVNPEG